MLDQVFEVSRKAAEASLQIQQAMFKQWMQDPASPMSGLSADWGGTMRKRWVELAIEALKKHRESLDASYRAGIETAEKVLRVAEAKSPDEAARLMGEVWRSVYSTLKAQTDARFGELQMWAEKLAEMGQRQEE